MIRGIRNSIVYLATFSLGNTVKPLGTVLLSVIVVAGPIALKVASGEITIMNLLRNVLAVRLPDRQGFGKSISNKGRTPLF